VSYTNILQPQSLLRTTEFREHCVAELSGMTHISRQWWVSPSRPLYIKFAWLPRLGSPIFLPNNRFFTLRWSSTNETYNMTLPVTGGELPTGEILLTSTGGDVLPVISSTATVIGDNHDGINDNGELGLGDGNSAASFRVSHLPVLITIIMLFATSIPRYLFSTW